MKKNIVTVIFNICLCLAFPCISYAQSCEEDAAEMKAQIDQYGQFIASDQHPISLLENVSGFETCGAEGYLHGEYVCPLIWDMHNWGDTIKCYDVKLKKE